MEDFVKRLAIGDHIPSFKLENQDGESINVESLLGKKNLVIYFYPRDNTLGCTMESCLFRDEYSQFTQAGAEVLGISSDTVESHKHFSSKYALPFTLLSDLGGKVRMLFGVPNAFGFIPGRVTYVVDKNGVVQHIFNSQIKPQKHVEEALRVLMQLN